MELSQDSLERWISEMATGAFHYTKVLDGGVEPGLYPQLNVMVHRAGKKGVCTPVSGRDGYWRPVDASLDEICWWEGAEDIGDNLKLPLGLNKYCHIPLPSLIIIAGKYNAGKTAFCINMVNQNLELWKDKLDFYVSEGAAMMKRKFDALNSFIPSPPPFKMYRRTENFSDVIKPDRLSVVDYLRVDMAKTYEIGNELFKIYNKLGDTGIAVVAMQKPPGERKVAFGGASTVFEPTLYMGMDKDVIGFEKIKVPKIMDIDPYLLKIEYKITKGVNFEDIHEVIG